MVKLGILICDDIYRERLVHYLMTHYANTLRLEIFLGDTEKEGWEQALDRELERASKMDGILTDYSGLLLQTLKKQGKLFVVTEEEAGENTKTEDGVIIMEKYQDVNRIVDVIMKEIGQEVNSLLLKCRMDGQPKVYGVYGLGANDYQMPFAVTLASILGEKQKVLLLDLQENSGLLGLTNRQKEAGLEELLVMTESGRYSRARLMSCIGHMDGVDYVYPARNTENICEAGEGTVPAMLGLLIRETDYDVVIINFGSRFLGFFDTLQRCEKVFLLEPEKVRSEWRQQEFYEELHDRKVQGVEEHMIPTEIPMYAAASLNRLIEQWRWNEIGDRIRGFAAAGGGD